jgi:hypothetical protein
LIPGAVSDAAKKYQQDPKIQNLIQEYSGKIFGSASQEVSQKYPLVAMLPHLDLDFRIDYGKGVRSKDTVSSTAIYIRAFSPAARREAISWIRQQGYDPSDYEIVFSNFTNPFSSGASQ